MFPKGQEVKCIDAKMRGIGPGLEQGKVYHVEEHLSPEKCKKTMPGNIPEWEKEGGRVELKEHPGCYWFGRRFAAQVCGIDMDN